MTECEHCDHHLEVLVRDNEYTRYLCTECGAEIEEIE